MTAAALGVAGADLAAVGQGTGVVPVPVVGVLVDQRVGPGVRLDRVRTDEVRARDQVPEVAVDRVDEERLAQGVPVMTPRVGRAMGEHLESLADRVKSPESAPDGHAQLFRRAGDADLTGRRCAATAIEPAVGPPPQAVGERMMIVDDDGEPVEHDLGRAVGDVVPIPVGDEEQPRRAEQPDAPEAVLDAGEHLDLVGEHRATVETAVGVGVLEDQDAIAMAEVEPIRRVGIGVVLGDPEPAPTVPGHGDRVLHVRLGREDRDPEPRSGHGSRPRPRSRGEPGRTTVQYYAGPGNRRKRRHRSGASRSPA